MKKYKKAAFIIIGVLVISALITACSNSTAETSQSKQATASFESIPDTTEKETTESAVKQSSTSDTITKSAEQKSAGQTTTKSSATVTNKSTTTTQKQTTTKRQTTTKEVTTQKQTTTKKVTATEDNWDCNVDGHSCEVGPIGWVNSFDEATEKALEYASENGDSGNFRVKQCLWCGKYTATVTFR